MEKLVQSPANEGEREQGKAFLKDSTTLKHFTAADLIEVPDRGEVNSWLRQ